MAKNPLPVEVDESVRGIVAASRATVERTLATGEKIYGLNTYLGHRRNEQVPDDQLWLYQDFVVSTHVAAIGEPLTEAEARAVLASRISGMARGGSGVSLPVFEALVALLHHNVVPVIRRTGSIGAGDISQLAAIAEVVTGRGNVLLKGKCTSATDALQEVGLLPVELHPKDALAIISANSVSIGLGTLALGEVEATFVLANQAAALTLEAVQANSSPFHPAVSRAKRSSGQALTARHIRQLTNHSSLVGSSTNVQDALSLRTIPQVHGALRNYLDHAEAATDCELLSAADNPLVAFGEDALLSNGNFSTADLAISFEALRLAIAHVAMLSERRLHKILKVRNTLRSDRNEVQVQGRAPQVLVNAAAALLAEVKHAAQPVTLNATSLNDDVEDHASLAPQAVELTRRVAKTMKTMLAIEAVLASDTIALLPPQIRLGDGTAHLHALVQQVVERYPVGSVAAIVEDAEVALTQNLENGWVGTER